MAGSRAIEAARAFVRIYAEDSALRKRWPVSEAACEASQVQQQALAEPLPWQCWAVVLLVLVLVL